MTQLDMFPDQLKGSEVVKLAKRQLELQDDIERVENALAKLKQDLRQVQEIDLPNAMFELGLTELKLQNGAQVKIKPEVYCSISKEKADKAFMMLEAAGHSSLIKNELVCDLSGLELDLVDELLRDVDEKGVMYSQRKNIHALTLKAFVKEQLSHSNETGEPLPEGFRELLNVHETQKATIKKV